MLLRIHEWTRIDDPREYGPDVVNELRNLLTIGGCARRDARRENFYELECGGHTFYIYISPVNQDVMLVARWFNSPKEVCTFPAHLVA
jgi:hypothetical protein